MDNRVKCFNHVITTGRHDLATQRFEEKTLYNDSTGQHDLLADACGELRQTLITRIEGMIHDVQGKLHANNVEHETLDGLCFRSEKLPRQGARLVTAYVLDSSILNWIMCAYEKLIFCSQRVESEETGYRAALLNSGGRETHYMRPPCLFTKYKSRDSFWREVSPQCMLS